MGFRAKFIMFLVVYFVGIATGIYLVMPGETQIRAKTKMTSRQGRPIGAFKKNNGVAAAARKGIDKGVAVGKSANDQIGEIMKAYTDNQDLQP
jgi:hypothetical protein